MNISNLISYIKKLKVFNLFSNHQEQHHVKSGDKGINKTSNTDSQKNNHKEEIKSIDDLIDEYTFERIECGLPRRTAYADSAKIKKVITLTNQIDIRKIRGYCAKEACRLLRKLPSNAHKKSIFNGLSLLDIIIKNVEIGETPLTIATVKGYLQATSSFFKWAIAMEYTDINPFKGLKVPKEQFRSSKKRHAFTDEQLTSIFSMKMYITGKVDKNYHYWILLLLRYSGARLNELAQLYSDDVELLDGVWCFNFYPTHEDQIFKNKNAVRIVPISTQLIEHGFLDFYQSKQGHLFPELPLGSCGYGTNVSKWASYWRKKLHLGRGYDLHSFRHRFINELKQLEINESLVAAICGHEHDRITYGTYGKDYAPKRLLEIIDLINTDSTKNIARFQTI